jgi:hypothetical protein
MYLGKLNFRVSLDCLDTMEVMVQLENLVIPA